MAEQTIEASFPAEVTETRCCRRGCGARAYVFAEFHAGPLGWCSHHGTEDWDAINRQALVVTDHRDQVLKTPDPVADPS